MVKISSVPGGSFPVDQTARGQVGQTDTAASEGASDAAPDTAPAEPSGATVSISARGTDAAALLQGVSAADDPAGAPDVQRLTRSVAEGSYRPDGAKVAKALLSHERLMARKLDRD